MNPAAGKLSSQLAAKNSSGKGTEPKQPDRLVVSTRLSVRCRFWFRLADRLETSGTEHDGARCDRDSMDWQRRVRMCPGCREACRLISRTLDKVRSRLSLGWHSFSNQAPHPRALADGRSHSYLFFRHSLTLRVLISQPFPFRYHLSHAAVLLLFTRIYTYTYNSSFPLCIRSVPQFFSVPACVAGHSPPRPTFRSARDPHSATGRTETTSAESGFTQTQTSAGRSHPYTSPSQATTGSSRAT